LNMPPQALNKLCDSVNADIRQVLNAMSCDAVLCCISLYHLSVLYFCLSSLALFCFEQAVRQRQRGHSTGT
jgi:hypothetical protein